MRRSRSGYSGYRGRRTLHDILKWIAAVLAVLVVLLVAVLLFGQPFIVFTDGGPRVDLPSLFGGGEAPPEQPGSISVVVDPEPSQPEEEPTVEEESSPGMAAVELPVQSVLDGTAAAELEQAGANALVLRMKDQEGALAWASGQELAMSLELGAPAEVSEALRQWNAGSVYTVARVCCFRDNTVPYHRNSMALRASYGNWRDELGLRWLSPASPEAQDYLVQLCAELAELGFDEILLECCAFPDRGNLEAVSWGDMAEPAQREQTAEEFLTRVRQALEPYETQLSVQVDEAVLEDGGGAGSGLTPAVLERCADRLWLLSEATAEELAAKLSQAGITGGTQRLVLQTGALAGQSGTAQAVLEENQG